MTTEIDILATIKRFRGVPLSVEELFKVARIEDRNAQKAVMWLHRKNFIYRHKGQYHLTEPGEEYLQSMGLYTEKIKSLKKWKDEALTGMTECKSRLTHNLVSAPSAIDRAVLSTSTIDGPEGIRPDDMLIELESLRIQRLKLCRELNISLAEYKSLLQEGRIRVCRGGATEHIGIFDKHSRDGFQHICRVCWKKRRKKKK